MAPGNKSNAFTGSSVSKSQPDSRRNGSGTKRKKKRIKKSAKGDLVPEAQPSRCYSPLVYDPEVCQRELMQKYAKQPEALGISELRQYAAEIQTSQKAAVRMGVSNHISRFEIPMDIKLLENTTVHQYLKTYCRVCKRRQTFYKKFFDKYDRDKDGMLSIMETEAAVTDLYCNEIHPKQVKELIAVTSEEDEMFDSKLFFALCALSERMFYSTFVTKDASELYSERQWVETADFSAINWKFEGCNINTSLKRLFRLLAYRLGIESEEN
ncbi:uncharacterized protein LOC120927609 [Rana temporaria]|uniref:uncharacterized protein LOC120927609 n=1 Tax=Rana temporaria TaxID=8407 RepID=UPI001AADCC99|nr:uncharacterized protein LOC120927609 [Rana temporaria]XP_040194333.1 uncharacterized protein LOC120927609 [Rana temporaria]